MKARDVLAVFNRGIIDKKALARVDVNRVALSAETQTNWIPRVLGSMSLRPGTICHGEVDGPGAYIPFVFRRDDVAILEFTPNKMRIWDDGDTLEQETPVTASILNPTFENDISGWIDEDEAGAVSSHNPDGYLELFGTRYTESRRRQTILISQENTPHRLRIKVERGPLLIRIGTTGGADDVFRQAVLRTGVHSIAFVPPIGPITIELASSLNYPVLVDEIDFVRLGVVEVDTPYDSLEDIRLIRWQRINDVIFLACSGYQQRRIERRENGSWSFVLYEADDGPYLGPNTDGTRITPSSISGEVTLTSSRSLFRSTSVGQIFSLTSQGQKVEADLSSESAFTNDIRITGVGDSREFRIIREGTFTGTLTLQRSDGETGSFVDVRTFTTEGTTTFDDGFDNSISFYRIGFDVGDYTSGTADVSLEYANGSITGVVRVTEYISDTEVRGVVLSDLGEAEPTEIWEAGVWNDLDGYPTATALFDGRLWWLGQGRSYGSISDIFNGFDPDFEGDAGPINRSVGDGATDNINWALPLQRLIAGSDSSEHSIRSTTFEEPITDSNYNVKDSSTQGSAAVPALRIDGRGQYVQASGRKVYEVDFDLEKSDYTSADLTALVPDIAGDDLARLVRSALQRQPDTRSYYVRSDGKIAMLVRDRAEDVLAWVILETAGEVIDVTVLPGESEDRVFWMVKRTINGEVKYFHEEMARSSQCVGGEINRQADCSVLYDGAAATVIPGLSHLEGEEVVAWGNGKDLGAYVVSGGSITLSEPASRAWVGLGYTAPYRSSKLALQLPTGITLTQMERIDHIGFVLVDTHTQGLKYGPDFDRMDDLPLVERGALVDTNSVWDEFDGAMMEFNDDWSTDPRVCLMAAAPRPVTVMAAVINIDRQQKAINSPG